MKTCSAWLVVGVLVQLAALVGVIAGFWYASEFIPNVPVRMSGKGLTHTPRDDMRIEIAILFASATVFAAVLNLVGLVRGPRTRGCLVAGLPSVLLVATPFVWAALVQVLNRVTDAL